MAVKNNISKRKSPVKKINYWWFAIISIFFCQLLMYTWIRTESTQTLFRISKAQENLIIKTSYHKELSLERDRLKSDDRITRIARTKLNLSTETVNQTIYLTDPLSGDKG